MARFETLDTLPVLNEQAAGARVLVRGDLNVPMRDGVVTEATRIERLAPILIGRKGGSFQRCRSNRSLNR